MKKTTERLNRPIDFVLSILYYHGKMPLTEIGKNIDLKVQKNKLSHGERDTLIQASYMLQELGSGVVLIEKEENKDYFSLREKGMVLAKNYLNSEEGRKFFSKYN
jgi:hypothetical protein